jgi:hypothetical protein
MLTNFSYSGFEDVAVAIMLTRRSALVHVRRATHGLIRSQAELDSRAQRSS